MTQQRKRNGGSRLVRKYENLKARLAAMLADGSFHLLEACRRMELLRKLSRRLHALNRLFLRVGLTTAALAAGFLLLATAAQGAPGFVPQQNRFPFGNDNPLSEVNIPGLMRPCLGDMDGDGDIDALIGLYDGTVLYYENRGTRRHANLESSGSTVPGMVAASGDAMPFAADLDGDGDLDVVIGQQDGTLAYFENNGDVPPTFLERVGVDNPFAGIDVGDSSCPLLADFDGDGDLDLMIGAAGVTVPFYYENTGTAAAPVFVARTGADSPFQPGDTLDLPTPAAADLDDDGDLDLVVGDLNGDVFLFENIGTGKKPAFALRIGPDNPFDGANVAGNYVRPALADLDNDGDVDAMIASDTGRVFFFENIGTPANADFVERVTFGYLAVPTFADLDGDGDLDLVVGLVYGTFSYYENTGTADAPAFVLRTGAASPLNGISVAPFASPTFADLDDDNDLDLLIGDKNGTLRYFENTGDAANPAFIERIDAANPFDAFTMSYNLKPALVDIDGDGDVDCFVGEKYGTIRFLENTGTAAIPSFTERLDGDNPLNGILPDTSYMPAPAFADFDGDGDFDCQVGVFNYYGTAILYAENDGNATDPNFTLAAGGDNPFAAMASRAPFLRPVVVDIDADGQPDAFVGDKYAAVKHYVLSEQLTNGSGFTIMAADVENVGVPLAVFTKKPTVTSGYFDPVKDRNETKPKTAKASVLTKIDAAAPPDTVDCEWKSKIRLIDAKALKAAYKQGDSARDVLNRIPQEPLTMELAVSTIDDTGAAFTDDNVMRISVMPPTITEVISLSSFATTWAATAGDVLAIRGLHFSTKAKVWMEYVDAKGVTKMLNLKAIGTKPYPNAKGDVGKAIMNPDNGDSLLVIQIPAKWPKDWDHGADHNFVLDNGIGLATIAFWTNP